MTPRQPFAKHKSLSPQHVSKKYLRPTLASGGFRHRGEKSDWQGISALSRQIDAAVAGSKSGPAEDHKDDCDGANHRLDTACFHMNCRVRRSRCEPATRRVRTRPKEPIQRSSSPATTLDAARQLVGRERSTARRATCCRIGSESETTPGPHQDDKRHA